MAFLSEILNEEPGIPPKHKEQASLCLMCGKKIEKGGCGQQMSYIQVYAKNVHQ